jgi:hypothetical protein
LVDRLLLGKTQFSHIKIRKILAFLRNYIVFDQKETYRIFDKQIDEITHQKHNMGILEYLAQERTKEIQMEVGEQKNRLFVENLLKGTDFSMAKIASLAAVSVYYVKKVKSSLHKKPTTRRPK